MSVLMALNGDRLIAYHLINVKLPQWNYYIIHRREAVGVYNRGFDLKKEIRRMKGIILASQRGKRMHSNRGKGMRPVIGSTMWRFKKGPPGRIKESEEYNVWVKLQILVVANPPMQGHIMQP